MLDPERQQTSPRSAQRYRPLVSDDRTSSRPGPLVARTSRVRFDAHTTVPPTWSDDLDQEERLPRRRQAIAPPSRRVTRPPEAARRRIPPGFFVGVGLVATLLLWFGLTQVIAWGTSARNTLKYGYPRTTQLDAVFGHQDSASHPTHLIATNLHGEVILIEFPGGDVSHAKDYLVATLLGAGSDQEPVELRLIDPGHTGKPDLVITIGDTQSTVLVNEQGSFRLPTPAEREQLQPYLQQK